MLPSEVSIVGPKMFLSRCKNKSYKDQCISSKSTSPRFVSVSRRLMITAMAASSLVRLWRPGPTTLSKSSCGLSPYVRDKTKQMWGIDNRSDTKFTQKPINSV